jgi:predicted phage-related endonuclease
MDRQLLQFASDSPAEFTKDRKKPVWPSLDQLRFSAQELDERRQAIGANDANIILGGDTDKLRRLWLEKRGECRPEDLSDVFPVMLGCWTEVLNRHWFEKITGQTIIACGEVLSCPSNPWRRCTLDGLVAENGAIWEAKHTNAFATPDQVLERYMPQLQHSMAVARADRAVMAVIFGNHKYEIIEVASDWVYQAELFDAELSFWNCVQSGQEPVPVAAPPAPRPVGTREVCLEGNNQWASAAFDWLDNREAAKAHADATKTIKSLIDEDVARAFGHGIEVKRSKSGALSIRELC